SSGSVKVESGLPGRPIPSIRGESTVDLPASRADATITDPVTGATIWMPGRGSLPGLGAFGHATRAAGWSASCRTRFRLTSEAGGGGGGAGGRGGRGGRAGAGEGGGGGGRGGRGWGGGGWGWAGGGRAGNAGLKAFCRRAIGRSSGRGSRAWRE